MHHSYSILLIDFQIYFEKVPIFAISLFGELLTSHGGLDLRSRNRNTLQQDMNQNTVSQYV